jgi:hypothetical protein
VFVFVLFFALVGLRLSFDPTETREDGKAQTQVNRVFVEKSKEPARQGIRRDNQKERNKKRSLKKERKEKQVDRE